MRRVAGRFRKYEGGSTAVEYAVIAGIIGLSLVAVFGMIRDGLSDHFSNVQTELKR